jgi:hypothetical protein
MNPAAGVCPDEEAKQRVVPAFAKEAEEAEWWYKNRNIRDRQFAAATRPTINRSCMRLSPSAKNAERDRELRILSTARFGPSRLRN